MNARRQCCPYCTGWVTNLDKHVANCPMRRTFPRRTSTKKTIARTRQTLETKLPAARRAGGVQPNKAHKPTHQSRLYFGSLVPK
jgi:hypothetical protein